MNRLISFVAMLLLIASCTSEIDQVNSHSRGKPSDEKTVFFASTENTSSPETKVYADENLKVLWNADDRISIFDFTTYNSQFAFTGDDGDTAGGFEQVGEDGEGADIDYVYAAYPYHAATQMDESGILTMMLPAEQQYKEDSFGIGANTMVAVTDGNFLAFKNVGGYLSLRLYGDDVKVSRITIKGNNGEKIAGKASITMPFGDVPLITMDEAATEEISIVCDPAVKIGSSADAYTDFWFVIPPVTFEKGFTITVMDDKGGVFEKATSKSFSVTRNTLDWMNSLKVIPVKDNIAFYDAQFKAFCVQHFDADGDGEVSTKEAESVTEMSIPAMGPIVLQGIEFFKNLRELYCDGPSSVFYLGIVSLDVSPFKSLSILSCRNNQLTQLDLSNNCELTKLDCHGNQFTELDVSLNTALIELDCSSNQLSSLDVGGNHSLQKLICSENPLNVLDVSNNRELKELSCCFNGLSQLNVQNNTTLTDLKCFDNQLTELDVSHNPDLSLLICDDNQLTSLDVSQNTSLKNLLCGNNRLTAIDVSNNPLLMEFYCNCNELTELDLSNNKALKVLGCYINQIMELDFSENYLLMECTCHSNQINELNISHLLSLKNLNCTDNAMTVLYMSFGQSLNVQKDSDTEIQYIGVFPKAITDNQFRSYLFDCYDMNMNGSLSLSECESITELVVNTEKVASLQGIEYFKNLQSLTCKPDFSSSSINPETGEWHLYNSADEEVVGLLTSLDVSNNPALQYLDCRGNQLTSLELWDQGSLTILNTSFNNLTWLDVSNSLALTELSCCSNPLTVLYMMTGQEIVNMDLPDITIIEYK